MLIKIAERIIGVARYVARKDVESCLSVKIGQRLLGFAEDMLLFPPLG